MCGITDIEKLERIRYNSAQEALKEWGGSPYVFISERWGRVGYFKLVYVPSHHPSLNEKPSIIKDSYWHYRYFVEPIENLHGVFNNQEGCIACAE